jgi:hypothetical protein
MPEPVPPPAPVQPVKKRKAWPWAVLVVVLLMAVGGYFGALPYYQLKQYKDQAAHRHQALVLAVKPFVDSFLDDVAKDDNSTSEQSLKEIDQAQSHIKAAQDLINTDRQALTAFRAFPLLDKTYPGYGAMKKTAELEKQYIDAADKTLREAQDVTVYAKDFNLKTKDLEGLEKKADTLSTTDTKVLANQVDAIAAEMQAALDKITAMQPPADIKSYHDKMAAAFKEFIVALRDLAKGVRTLDMKAVESATSRFDTASKAMDDATKQFEKDYTTSSQMAKDIATLRDLEKQIKY